MLSLQDDLKKSDEYYDSKNHELRFHSFDALYELKNIQVKVAFTNLDYEPSILILVSDTTYVSTITKLQSNDQFKTMVLASVSHELRTPLNGSMSMLQAVMADPRVPSSLHEMFLVPAFNSLKMQLRLVNDILDYSQIKANKFRMVFTQVNLKQLILDACGVVELQIKKKNLYLKVVYDDRITNYLKTDPNRFTQVLLNLLSNSVKFTSQGGITITCKLKHGMTNIVQIAVQDSGLGMKQEDVSRLFQQYTKIDLGDNAHMNSNGCGLGLNIANKLAMALGRGEDDHMLVESEEQKGSTFTFFIEDKDQENKVSLVNTGVDRTLTHMKLYQPLESKEKDRDSGEAKASWKKGATFGKSDTIEKSDRVYKGDSDLESISERASEKNDTLPVLRTEQEKHLLYSVHERASKQELGLSKTTTQQEKSEICTCPEVLIVDDDPMNTYSLEAMVGAFGITGTSAFNGQEALNKIEQRSGNLCGIHCRAFRFVFLDYEMPVMNGLQTAIRIRKGMSDGTYPNMRLIGCTGHEDQTKIQECLDAGIHQVITKPIYKKELKEILFPKD